MKLEEGQRLEVKVELIEFVAGGNTIWVQGLNGTVLRIKTMGKIEVNQSCQNPCSHSDILIQGDISICISENDCQ